MIARAKLVTIGSCLLAAIVAFAVACDENGQTTLERRRHRAIADSTRSARIAIAIELSRDPKTQDSLALALHTMSRDHDAMRDVDFWTDRGLPSYVNSRSFIGAYIVDDDRATGLRLKISYVADDWLFVHQYLLRVGSVRWQLDPPEFGDDAVQTDNGNGKVWEWWDTFATDQQIELLEAIASAETATIRYQGRHYYRDRGISAAERASIRRTLVAYRALRATRHGS